MVENARDQGQSAARSKQPLQSCPFPDNSAEHGQWMDGYRSVAGETPELHADTPFDHVRGLSHSELADVIGADDYEAGADDVAPRASSNG